MSNERDFLGLAGLLPCPAWMAIDAARERRFTGALIADADGEVSVYLDRGRIYLAERASDPPLGDRLVGAGVISSAQLEHGAVRIGRCEHLGRLFERVPSIDRDAVLVIVERLTDARVRNLAARDLHAVDAIPYRYHPAGIHHWHERAASAVGTVPVTTAPSRGRTEAAPGRQRARPADPTPSEPRPPDVERPDDRERVTSAIGESMEFELTWPSGETVEITDAPDAVPGASNGASTEHPDDRGPSSLAVRRAMASVDTGALDARRRLVEVAANPNAAVSAPSKHQRSSALERLLAGQRHH